MFKAGRGEMHQQLAATRTALLRNRAARNRHQAVRARHDMRTWQVERRKRTRHLIELGGLVVKAVPRGKRGAKFRAVENAVVAFEHFSTERRQACTAAPGPALINSLCMALPFAPVEKQALLEAPDLEERRAALAALLEIDAAEDAGDDDAAPSVQ